MATNPKKHKREIVERVKVIRERLDRLRISEAGYRIDRHSQRRIRLTEDETETDSHTIHLIPRE